MCLIERKTYIHSDREETVETTRLCNRAVGQSPCNRIERKNLGSINVVKAKPPKPSSPSNRRILTDSSYGRRRSGVDISNRSSNSSFRPSTIMTEPSPQLSPASPPSTASSPSIVEIKPKAPTPPTAGAGLPPLERLRSPYPPTLPSGPPLVSPTSPPDPKRKVGPDGTAIYERPPSLEIPRVYNNERQRPSAPAREAPTSSMKAQADDTDEDISSRRRGKRPSNIDTSRRPTSSDSPSLESPGLSNLPGIESLRRDFEREDSRHDSKLPERERNLRFAEDERRPRDEEDRRQSRLEQDRLASSARRRQSTRQDSRDRHRQDAADRLEGQRNDPIDDEVAAEVAQMARERARTAARRRDSELSQRYIDEQPRWDADDRYADGTNGPVTRRRSRRITNDAPSSPSSTRSSARPVTLHQRPSTGRNSAIAERGNDVLAREQARARNATQNLNDVPSVGARVEEERYYDDEYERAGEVYVGEGQESGRRRRRPRRRERRE